jgi:hypothetical protein
MIKIPLSSHQAATAALALYSACKPHTLWMHRIAVVLANHLGARGLPGRSVAWTPPMETEIWERLCARWRGELGSFNCLAVAERSQQFRSGCALLLLEDGEPRAFIKLRHQGAAALQHEYATMQEVWRSRPRSFAIPEPLGVGGIAEWEYVAMASLPSPRHQIPWNPPLDRVTTEISEGLASLARPEGTPDHWRPMHGDFTPWNLRQMPDRSLILFDWEDSAWAPPGADDVLYRASAAALRGATVGAHAAQEAVAYWLERVSARTVDAKRERKLNHALRTVLSGMRDGPSAREEGR